MNITEKIKSILMESYQDDFSEEETQNAMNRITDLGNWEEVRNNLLSVLYEDDQTLWYETVAYIYYFLNKGYSFEEVKTIAILNNCLTLSDDLDSNLIWTITTYIKSIPYLSDYEPYNDTEVLNEMNRIKEFRNGS